MQNMPNINPPASPETAPTLDTNNPPDTVTETSPETSPETKPARSTIPIANDGRRIDPTTLPPTAPLPFPAPHHTTNYSVDPNVDYTDISALNRDINRARAQLFNATRALRDAERFSADKKRAYKSAWNRAHIGLSGGSERQRIAITDTLTEELYSHTLVADTLVNESLNNLRAIRAELDALAGLSHNIRAQMQVM